MSESPGALAAYAGLVLVIAATTLLAPFGLKALYRRFPGEPAA